MCSLKMAQSYWYVTLLVFFKQKSLFAKTKIYVKHDIVVIFIADGITIAHSSLITSQEHVDDFNTFQAVWY